MESAHLENPNALDYSGGAFYMGSAEKKGGALIAPGLSVHVAGKLRDEAAIAKETRKAKEVRGTNAPRPSGGGPDAPPPGKKGDGKKGDGKKGKKGEQVAPKNV